MGLRGLRTALTLDRPIAQVDRFREGGSASLVYGLDIAGGRFLKEKLGISVAGADWKARNRSYTRENLDHTLATSGFLVDVELACRAQADFDFLPFEEVLKGAPTETRERATPGRWPVGVRWHGGEGDVHLVPDAIFGLRLTGSEQALHSYFFVEIDRGTMTIEPALRVQRSGAFLHRATILRKLLAYGESWRQELHVRHFGFRAPRVLFLTTSPVRAEAMRRTAERTVVRTGLIPAGALLFGQLADITHNCELFDAGNNAVKLLPGLG